MNFEAIKNQLLQWWGKAKPYVKKALDPVIRILDASLETPERKRQAYLIYGLLELLLAILIAMLHIGIWHGYNVITVFFAYLGTSYRFPWGTFLLLSAVLFGLTVYVFWLHLQQADDRNFNLSESNVYGNARQISQEELSKVSNIVSKTAAVNTVLGEYDRAGMLITMKPEAIANNNICVFGSSGCGKSYSFVKPYIVQCIRRRESVIVTDSKGEIRADTIELARRHGYTVKVLNLKDPLHSDGIDFLSELKFDDIRATIFAETFMNNTGNLKDPHFEAEKSLLKAVCLYQERNPSIPPEEKTFYNAYAMLQKPEDLDEIFRHIKHDSTMSVAYAAYQDFIAGSANLRGNVVTNLRARLALLSSPPIRKLTSVKDIDLTLPAQKPCIYYVVVSDQHQTMKVLSSLFFSFAAQDLVEFADKQPNRRCPVPVNFLMEEFYSCIGFLPNLTNYLSTFRSRALNIVLIMQQLGQLKELYGDEGANTITGNCATWLCLGCNDDITAEWLSWRTGESTVKVKTEQHQPIDPIITFGFRHSTGDGRRAFYNPNEIMKIKRGEVLIVWQGYDCLKTTTMGIPKYIEYEKGRMPSISTEVHIPLANTVAREELQRIENERVQTYNDWIAQGGNPWKDYTYPVCDTSGPATGTEIPECISYPDMEAAALAYAESVQEAQRLEKEKRHRAAYAERFGTVIAEDPEEAFSTQEEPTAAETEPAAPKTEQIVYLEHDFQWQRVDLHAHDGSTSAVAADDPTAEVPSTSKPAARKKNTPQHPAYTDLDEELGAPIDPKAKTRKSPAKKAAGSTRKKADNIDRQTPVEADPNESIRKIGGSLGRNAKSRDTRN